jgi:hypothetical protein
MLLRATLIAASIALLSFAALAHADTGNEILIDWRDRQPLDCGLGFAYVASAPRSSSVWTKTPEESNSPLYDRNDVAAAPQNPATVALDDIQAVTVLLPGAGGRRKGEQGRDGAGWRDLHARNCCRVPASLS